MEHHCLGWRVNTKGKGINGGSLNDEGMKGETVYAGSFWAHSFRVPP